MVESVFTYQAGPLKLGQEKECTSPYLNCSINSQIRYTGSQNATCGPQKSPRPFQGICKVKIVFIMMLRCYLSFLLCYLPGWCK